MQSSFSIKYHLTLLEFYYSSIYSAIRNKRLKKFYYLIPGILVLSGLLNFFLDTKKSSYSIGLIVQFLFPILLFLIFLFVGIFILCLIVQLIKPNYFKNINYEFTHWGMFKKGIGFEYSSPWSKILKMKETKSFFLLYVSENDAHIVQKRMFKNEEEINNFKSLVIEKIGLFN